ncbi:nicotinate-nucleotide adenylyltransferase [Methylocapsa palsarum]|uniref:Probable nicotinate-nucleotide adenylyltransferase n=1 Tax=Methylocapsa palsarum TaxID=1612308 RepID=A0A1I4BWN0_9HYPH|nr:nicotinate-nucleotide adenylyltransferase [Methylocapsa palsarum]SFK73184.1 nicotinate-nucleotide adenylyltransferase [Methylocapsa palsarum]
MTLVRLPPFSAGMRIGLFGGSFNPAHQGHRAVSLLALRRLRLDRIWWLVTPGNPLKDPGELVALDVRVRAGAQIANDPRIVVTGLESDIGTRFTFETISFLKTRCRGVRFVWMMGADNFPGFHVWRRWRDIGRLVPIAVIDRPGSTLVAPNSRAAQMFAPYRIDESRAGRLADMKPPAYVFLHGPRSALSSTALRAKSPPPAPPVRRAGCG